MSRLNSDAISVQSSTWFKSRVPWTKLLESSSKLTMIVVIGRLKSLPFIHWGPDPKDHPVSGPTILPTTGQFVSLSLLQISQTSYVRPTKCNLPFDSFLSQLTQSLNYTQKIPSALPYKVIEVLAVTIHLFTDSSFTQCAWIMWGHESVGLILQVCLLHMCKTSWWLFPLGNLRSAQCFTFTSSLLSSKVSSQIL